MSESPLEKLDLPALDALANDIKARPAGAIDGLIMTQIKIVTDRSAALRRTTDQMELRQRRCGSQPTGPCRSALVFLKDQRDREVAGLRMDRLKLRALNVERSEALERLGGSGKKNTPDSPGK